jgi:hypothetical protein
MRGHLFAGDEKSERDTEKMHGSFIHDHLRRFSEADYAIRDCTRNTHQYIAKKRDFWDAGFCSAG